MSEAASTSPDILEIAELIGGYGDYRVLHGIRLAVRPGEILAILGPNGHGKTTLLRTISGLLRPDHGTIRLKGDEIQNKSPSEIVRRGLAHIPQGDEVFPQMTVEENLMAGAYLRWPTRRHRMDELLEIFSQLKSRLHLPARVLSGGERRMLALARGLMCSPSLLMVDEPSLGLAPVIREAVYAMLKQITVVGTALLIVEEKASHLQGFADRICVLEGGVIVMEGKTDELLSDSERLIQTYLG